jgi:calcium/calmodulin-dependent protein kinase (CaM kinase) II
MPDTSETTAGQLIRLTQDLLDSIDQRDWSTYQQLCDETLTAFEPETVGHLVEGLPFHEFYLAPGPDGLPRQSTISSAHVRRMGDVAVVSYVRLLQNTDSDGRTSTRTMEETRVWQLQEDRWQHVHFHRSPAGATSL